MPDTVIKPRWHTMTEVAQMLGFGLSKTKMLVLTGEIRSIKVGHNRRIMPNGWTSTSPARSRNQRYERPGAGERRGLDLPVPQRLRRLRVGHEAERRRARKYVYGKSREIVHDISGSSFNKTPSKARSPRPT